MGRGQGWDGLPETRYPKPETRTFFRPETRNPTREIFENPTRNPTFSLEFYYKKGRFLALWPSKILKIFACGAGKWKNLVGWSSKILKIFACGAGKWRNLVGWSSKILKIFSAAIQNVAEFSHDFKGSRWFVEVSVGGILGGRRYLRGKIEKNPLGFLP